jgi:hypothetical protein
MTLPPVYVFALGKLSYGSRIELESLNIVSPHDILPILQLAEKSVLRKKEEAERELESGGSREELERNLLIKMKSVTKASEDVCVSLLENNSYDLKTSIEAYFASSNS